MLWKHFTGHSGRIDNTLTFIVGSGGDDDGDALVRQQYPEERALVTVYLVLGKNRKSSTSGSHKTNFNAHFLRH